MTPQTFHAFFQRSFSAASSPEAYQVELADSPLASRIINIPTGLGKTAAVIHAWLWNRVIKENQTWPRRLIYCLPMRTLVEQTYDETKKWLDLHDLIFDNTHESRRGKVGLHVLMGGEDAGDWDLYPEEDAIIIGTQDMLLSRALNRGYGMSRFRWPMHYGLLNNDCLWVFDEVQLMGAGLPTTAQLTAFRDGFGTAKSCYSWWMSATNAPEWLETVDFKTDSLAAPIELKQPYSERADRIRNAKKSVTLGTLKSKETKALCQKILLDAKQKSALTLVVVNTVKKAKEIHAEIDKLQAKAADSIQTVLLHSQFRADDRKARLNQLLEAEKSGSALIAISTQIIEAGVDISARSLFTEMAPWSSLVQRFGRCNRRGTDCENAQIFLIEPEKSQPYEDKQIAEVAPLAKKLITEFGANASPANLREIPIPDCDKPVSNHVIRRRDFLDLFDTTPDLAGQDIDIDRWVREIEDTGIQLFWRSWPDDEKNQMPPRGDDFPAPQRKELCPAPIGKETCDWFEKRQITPLRWDYLEDKWTKVTKEYGKLLLVPGQIYLIPCHKGGYSPLTGFNTDVVQTVECVDLENPRKAEATISDPVAIAPWQSISEHTDRVCDELANILSLTQTSQPALPIAGRWHDLGKAHKSFKAKIKAEFDSEAAYHLPVAKAPREAWRKDKYFNEYRSHFRHELASALAIIQPTSPIPDELRDLVAWLVACHHGKIRLSIRSLPDETLPKKSSLRYARGIWDFDTIESVDLGGGIISSPISLSLEPMEIGLCIEPPFENQPSWTDRMLALRDSADHGPLRLAYWETLLRAADQRASKNITPSAP